MGKTGKSGAGRVNMALWIKVQGISGQVVSGRVASAAEYRSLDLVSEQAGARRKRGGRGFASLRRFSGRPER